MEEGEKGCNWRAEMKQRGARKRQKHRWRTIRVQRPSISRGTVYRVGRTGVREETGTAGEQRGRKETDKPTKMETPSRAGG